MAIDVYWACFEDEWLRATAPVEIKKIHFSTDIFKETEVIRCPATRDFLHNYYGVKSIYTYDIHVENDRCWAEQYDQTFFNNHIIIRSKHPSDIRCLSFITRFIYFTDVESLLMSFEQPFLEDNSVNDSCILFPGQFDIGKWFRPIDFAFRFKSKTNHLSIKENDIYCYLKFHTQEEIKFTQFRTNKNIYDLVNDVIKARNNQPNKYRSLEYRYESFSTKNLILQEIKKNVLT